MTLEEAIKHCNEVERIKKQESAEAELQGCDRYALKCEKCASEHHQLAEWLKELQRARILLRATYDILKKCDESYYVIDVLAQTAIWDDVECDGHCLMEEIEDLLELEILHGR